MLKDFPFWAQIASRFLIRSTRATFVLSLMILSAVSVMIFLSAMAVGVNDAMIRNSVGLYSGNITGFDLPPDLAQKDLQVEGVRHVLKRTTTPGILFHEGRVETIALIEVDPEEEAKATAMPKKTIAGRYLRNGERGVFLSLFTAEGLRVEPGDTVNFSLGLRDKGFPLTVAGTYRTGFEQLDRGVAFCPRNAIDLPEAGWSAAIFLEEGIDSSVVTRAYPRRLAEAGHFKPWADLMPDLRQLIDLNYVSMGIVLILVFGVVSLGVGCAFVIFILKNLREFGIMKALGVTSQEMATLIILKVALVSLAASGLGVLLGTLATLLFGEVGIDLTHLTSQNRYFTVSGMIFPRLTSFSLLTPPLLSLGSGLVAALWPAVLVIRKRAADILRAI